MSGARLRLSWLILFVDSARVCRFRITASRTRVLFKNDSRSPARYSSMRRMHSRMCPNTAGLTSERNRLFENLIADKRMECALRGNVHPSSQLLFQIGQESSWKKGSPVWSRLYQQVQIAVVTGVAPRKRAEHPDAPHAVPGGDRQNRIAFPFTKFVERHNLFHSQC